MLNIFSGTCWPLVYLLWKNVHSGPLPICAPVLITHEPQFLLQRRGSGAF